jgi:hypothetical protein
MTQSKTKKAYDEVLETINKHRDILVYDYRDLEEKSKKHLFGIELKEKYGLNIEPKDVHSLDFVRFSDDRMVTWFGDKYNRTISWEDEGRQPEDELLFTVSFGTGAYIFGDDYPVELFKEFFLELKSYSPKYIDTVNKCLYFSMDNAKEIFNKYPEILKKWHEKNKEDAKERKIKKLKDELEKLSTK